MPIETPFHNIIDLENSLTDLLHDVGEVRRLGRPGRLSLSTAPRLDDWSRAAMFSPCLVGGVVGHPLLGQRPHIHTSQVILIDVEAGWARTLSRFYRLGMQNKGDH